MKSKITNQLATTMIKNSTQEWPEPIVRVQSLSKICKDSIPERYIKPPSDRPSIITSSDYDANIPIIDLGGLYGDPDIIASTLGQISEACHEWGFFQVVNHGVSHDLMDMARETWRQFFHLPMEVKQQYANSPKTYEGYGSRLGVEKGAILDWSDYYYLHYLPLSLKDCNKWPAVPPSCREVLDEYGKELVKLCGKLMKVLSINLGLEKEFLQNAFGGEDIGACLRVNYYPKCPKPDLTLGLSSHSDPGGMTLLLPDDQVAGLQVRKNNNWITVKPARHAFIVNIGDQIQWDVLSNSNHVQEVANIANGSHSGNCISVLQDFNTTHNGMLILQESRIDSSGALVVYSPVDIRSINIAISGEDPSFIPLIPSGFSISPDGQHHQGGGDGASTSYNTSRSIGSSGGSLITIAFQILVNNMPSAEINMESVTRVTNLINTAIQKIKASLNCPSSS